MMRLRRLAIVATFGMSCLPASEQSSLMSGTRPRASLFRTKLLEKPKLNKLERTPTEWTPP